MRGFRAIAEVVLLLLALTRVTAFSSGGGAGLDDNGIPFLQSCDALTVCTPVCPPGMTAVAPPTRSNVYSFESVDGATSYEPGELIPFELCERSSRNIYIVHKSRALMRHRFRAHLVCARLDIAATSTRARSLASATPVRRA